MVSFDNKREVWLDWLRVVACFLVMLTHSTEPFYLGGEGSLILSQSDAVWVAVMDVFSRAAVVLFVIASAYLQVPLRYPAMEFFRRRALRILPPYYVIEFDQVMPYHEQQLHVLPNGTIVTAY